MEILLKIHIYSEDNQKGLIYNKKYQSDIVPQIGEKVVDSIFAEAKKVIDVIYNFKENICTIYLESKEMRKGSLNGHVQEVAALHDWILAEE